MAGKMTKKSGMRNVTVLMIKSHRIKMKYDAAPDPKRPESQRRAWFVCQWQW